MLYADNAEVESKSSGGLTKMMVLNVSVFEARETKNRTHPEWVMGGMGCEPSICGVAQKLPVLQILRTCAKNKAIGN